jgi:hypothetical protein
MLAYGCLGSIPVDGDTRSFRFPPFADIRTEPLPRKWAKDGRDGVKRH